MLLQCSAASPKLMSCHAPSNQISEIRYAASREWLYMVVYFLTLFMANIFLYCFPRAFFGSVRTCHHKQIFPQNREKVRFPTVVAPWTNNQHRECRKRTKESIVICDAKTCLACIIFYGTTWTDKKVEEQKQTNPNKHTEVSSSFVTEVTSTKEMWDNKTHMVQLIGQMTGC